MSIVWSCTSCSNTCFVIEIFTRQWLLWKELTPSNFVWVTYFDTSIIFISFLSFFDICPVSSSESLDESWKIKQSLEVYTYKQKYNKVYHEKLW